MDGVNADSDHSMTWEDFFGSTSDLTPTLIGIFDSILEPTKKNAPEVSRFQLTAKDTRNDPPLNKIEDKTHKMVETTSLDAGEAKAPTKIPSCVKLPRHANKSTLYAIRTKIESDVNGVSDTCHSITTSESSALYTKRTIKTDIRCSESNAYDNLSPNVKRIISSATETSSALKFQKKMPLTRKAVRGHKSNIPLVGTTSKLTQSGVEILPSVEIYDQPTGIKPLKPKCDEDKVSQTESQTKIKQIIKPEFKIDEEVLYEVPKNNKPVLNLSTDSKTVFECLSLPYIDQSIELNTTSTDREFDPKISPNTRSPDKNPPKTPANTTKANSLTRNVIPPTKIRKPEALATGSTGNLKTSSDKEPSKTPTIEVSRPLSMSSIASSSSTSSSGAQNKGVNSAYLASIESLDDHSDADLTSGNGSNNFVNNAGLKVIANDDRSLWRQHYAEMSGLSQLERVCAEIVYTENNYVRDLQQVVEGYLHVWRRENTFSDEELNELFNNIEDIYNFNRSLCDELNNCRLDATCIARCFVNSTTGFSVYTSYCTGYPVTMERLAALASNSDSAREFRERQMALGHPLPLASYLLKPVQRILKYHLLLQNVVKQCASSETEYALLKMTGIAKHIDDMKRKHEHSVRVQEIQSLLYGWNGPDLTTYGELCAEGTFRVFGAKAMRHVFLFDKMFLVTKNRDDGILAYKTHIMCNNLMLVEALAGAPLSFHVLPWDAPRATLTLHARSPRHKREWTLLLKRVILENYNAVIPTHAKQLVMELGQNKTDDDMLAEKSHNLKTQASMRKQLSAPEYLEKRKMDRDRRNLENGLRGRLKKGRKKLEIVRVDTGDTNKECDCAQVSFYNGVDYTCDACYVDLCSDCEKDPDNKVGDGNNVNADKCPDCNGVLKYIDAGSVEHLNSKSCKCTEFKSSQESFGFNHFSVKNRGYHSSENISSYNEKHIDDKSKIKSRLKCDKIKENIVVKEPVATSAANDRKSRCLDPDQHRSNIRSKSKEDTQRSKLSKIGGWRRKSEPGLPPNNQAKKYSEGDIGNEKIEFECRKCQSNKITKKIVSDLETYTRQRNKLKNNVEIKRYNSKTVPKKISKIKKNRARGGRLGTDITAKFYADFSDVSAENVLHITESTDSVNVSPSNEQPNPQETISKDDDIDEETYKKLIEKTDSFKKNELEKVKYLNMQNVINEGSEIEDESVVRRNEEVMESGEETEQPLEQIISQLLLQNSEFQKLLKKQQQRSGAHRRHQRFLKSHSNPEEPDTVPTDNIKLPYKRQTSENLSQQPETQTEINKITEEDHIYETLRPDSRIDENGSRNNKSKLIYPNTKIARQHRLNKDTTNLKRTNNNSESDYVYLSFDKLDNIEDKEGIYEIPVKSLQKVIEATNQSDDYVTIDKQGPLIVETNKDVADTYDNIVEVCRRKKKVVTTNSEYLPMSPESPNTPEIWLSRQKEHFNVSRDRKSGSLPRSFQVNGIAEENGMSTFKTKSNTNSKTYLNRDGKVLSIDRPFTIASDQSEIIYDSVDKYMTENDVLKFNKNHDSDYIHDISQSTLELEEEIDRCYKTNFESVKLDKDRDELNTSQPNLNISTASSCEVLSPEDGKSKIAELMHPEHKIYKPTSNLRSFRNVLSRFKNKSPKVEESDAVRDKNEPKSPTNEKRSALNPRSYSRNLLQRFRSIIGDEQSEPNVSKTQTNCDNINQDIKVVITTSETSPTESTTNDALSKSINEQTTLTESQNEKNKLETLSNSCDNITPNHIKRPNFDKSVSVTSSVSSIAGVSTAKSCNSSYQSLNKLPMYMQGSKHLGARIAQADYVDPSILINTNEKPSNVNVLINRASIRPDSLFSNTSFVTTSSEGTLQEKHKSEGTKADLKSEKLIKEISLSQLDECRYEKTFEKIEHVEDADMFRDSAVFSDQEDTTDSKTQTSIISVKTIKKLDKKDQTLLKFHKVSVSNAIVTNSIPTPKPKEITTQVNDKKEAEPLSPRTKSKIAPPVPAKPKVTNIPTSNLTLNRNLPIIPLKPDIKPIETNTIKRNANLKSTFLRSESEPTDDSIHEETPNKNRNSIDNKAKIGVVKTPPPTASNIHLKRLTYERGSLDSATRKLKSHELKNVNEPKGVVAKSVLERRMEIESLTKTNTRLSQLKKPTQINRPKSIEAAAENSNEAKKGKVNIPNDLSNKDDIENQDKGSWVKAVVNKFQ